MWCVVGGVANSTQRAMSAWRPQDELVAGAAPPETRHCVGGAAGDPSRPLHAVLPWPAAGWPRLQIARRAACRSGSGPATRVACVVESPELEA